MKKTGKVITFYSFKGGVGRSMALANIACLLAQTQKKEKGRNVLMIDWDLDAPGLHHFFRKFGVISSKKGLVEFFIMLRDIIDAEIDKKYETQDINDDVDDDDDDDDERHVLEDEQAEKILDSVNFNEYVQQTDIPCLEILTCGCYDENYSSRVSNFNWPGLFNKAPGLFRQFAEHLTRKYQYVLIDSRTGYTDTSGICTMLMPEILVLVFTPNRQSITGAIEVLKKSAEYRKQFDDLRPLVGFPIPTRIDNAELDRKNDWRMGSWDKDIQGYQPVFEKAFKEIYALQECNLAPFFDKVQIPYIPYYSYGEAIAVLRESGDETNTLSEGYENFKKRLILLNAPWESFEKYESSLVKKPMRNIVGQTPRGHDFFPRTRLINLVYRLLGSNSNVYMAAPRRVGKTAIMRHLVDNPQENFEFKYIITESVDNTATYFKMILDSLHKLKRISTRFIETVGDIISKIREIEGKGAKPGTARKDTEYFEELKKLVRELGAGGTKIVIMVDEFPYTVENILKKNGKEEAARFLQMNQEIRQHANKNIRFLLTGSIGLPTIAEKIGAKKEISDLKIIEIPPLRVEEAREFTVKLLDSASISYEKEAIDYLLEKTEWLIPFHVQLLVLELIDECDDTNETVNKALVDMAFSKITDIRNDIYFEHYFSRLKRNLHGSEYYFTLAVLNELTQKEELSAGEVKALAGKHNLEDYPIVLRCLEFDGYIFSTQRENEKIYRFTSPVLRLWWRKYVKPPLVI